MSEQNGHLASLFDGLATRVRSANVRTIGFTSAVFGEGASTLAIGTSLSLASLGPGRVLLVDANWLRPSLTADAGVASGRGLADVLRGDAELGQTLVTTGSSRLAFLGAGELSGERPPLGALASFLDGALSSFGAIVVDLPPALAGESLILPWAASLQQLFIVVHSGATPFSLVRRAVATVAHERPQVVLNRMPAWTAGLATAPRLVTA